MDGSKAFEFKVGIFTLIGISIIFLIVFSIGDINISKAGYRIKVMFDFASGIGPAAPVRLAGVGIGKLEGIRLVYDEKAQRTRAEVTAWVQNDAKIEKDARITINQLGLLGEKYLEIFPGTPGADFMKNGDTITGDDPVPVERMTDNLAKLSESINSIVGKLERGEGTLGKLLTRDEIYNNVAGLTANLNEFSVKLNKGEGTLGKLLTEDALYRQLQDLVKGLEDFANDLKHNPWKLLSRPRGS